MDKSGLADEGGGPGTPGPVDRAHEEDRECLEKFPVLVGHKVADHSLSQSFGFFTNSDARLDLFLTFVER